MHKLELNSKISYPSFLKRSIGLLINESFLGIMFPIIIAYLLYYLTDNKNFIDEYLASVFLLCSLFISILQVYFLSSNMQSTVGDYITKTRFSTKMQGSIKLSKALLIVFTYDIITKCYFFFVNDYISNLFLVIFGERIHSLEFIVYMQIHAFSYHYTEKKQFLVDWLCGVVVQNDNSKNIYKGTAR